MNTTTQGARQVAKYYLRANNGDFNLAIKACSKAALDGKIEVAVVGA